MGRRPVFLLAGLFLLHSLVARAANLTAYDDALENGFADWSWATHSLTATAYVHSGTKAISFEPDGWGGLYFHLDAGIDTAVYDSLDFWINGGASGGQNVQVAILSGGYDAGDAPLTNYASGGAIAANAWTHVHVTFASLGLTSGILDGFWLQDNTGGNQPTLYLDDIAVDARTGPPPPPPPPTNVSVAINPAANRHPVSTLIYGVAAGGQPLANPTLPWPVERWGGNSTTRYNWQQDVWNSAADWFYINYANDNDPAKLPEGSAADQFLDAARAAGGEPLLTVPLIGWTPVDRVRRWGFSVSKYGSQQETECTRTGFPDWCNPDAGNGVGAAGADVTGNDPHDTSIPIDPSFVTGWMRHIAQHLGKTAGNGGLRLYALDNEPMLWDSTHRDVHPEPTTYDEMWQKTTAYAAAIKTQDPQAIVLGPVAWGWCEYFASAADNCVDGPDRQAHGGTPYLAWYLQQVQAYQQAHGVRLVDYLDIHFYPQAGNVALSEDETPSTAALRLRTLKSLYDPTYVDESWIGEPVMLVPRMKQWISQNAPGTKLAITEYNFGGADQSGGDNGISAALAQAEALAIFGREGVDLATRWVVPQPGSLIEDAFRMFLNFDGNGGTVAGDSISCASSNVDALGAYAIQAASGRLFVLLFNKSTGPVSTSVSIPASVAGSAALYGFDGTHHFGSAGSAPYANGSLPVTLPARSARLAVLDLLACQFPAPGISVSSCVPAVSVVAANALGNDADGFSWNLSDGSVVSGQGSETITFQTPAPGTAFRLSVTESSAAGCSAGASVTLLTSFADVLPSNIFASYICTLGRNGITTGCGHGDFCPGSPVTREQMAIFLLRSIHGDSYVPPACAAASFLDVACSSVYAPWINELLAEGITSGCGDGIYCPGSPVTREQMAIFLLRSAHGSAYVPPACAAPSFKDVPCSSVYAPWVNELLAEGITSGCGAGTYCPGAPVTREEMAAFLVRAFALN